MLGIPSFYVKKPLNYKTIPRCIATKTRKDMQKYLYILRHAKAETGAPAQDDHTRSLTDVGRNAAHAMGEFFHRQGVRLDKVICSTAVRARETWDSVMETYGQQPPLEYSDRLYLASVNEMTQLLAQLDESATRVMIVGHNPGLHQFCLKLAKSGTPALMDTLHIKFPTCAFAAIALGETPWRELAHAHGELKAFVTPSMLGDMEE